jgi:hypothetical protein
MVNEGASGSEKEPVWLITMRVADAWRGPVARSARDRCSVCRAEVWVAPSGVVLRLRYRARVICVPCALERAEEGVRIQPLTLQQRREVAAHDRSEYVRNRRHS